MPLFYYDISVSPVGSRTYHRKKISGRSPVCALVQLFFKSSLFPLLNRKTISLLRQWVLINKVNVEEFGSPVHNGRLHVRHDFLRNYSTPHLLLLVDDLLISKRKKVFK